ncbi:MAG: TetR/AcrR family transcriptional regulator C-terminal ligand-binding domain-containing protein, partial [Clostridia bacterium]|nr:TetR/AcrR family transcriptional regulator C-terminal ligand-binding domain-containing protein [Deltaproteobacteria bacterium]
ASKAELAVEAFFTETNLALRFPETGSAREDFTLQVLQLAKLLRGQLGTAFAAMIAGARSDPSLGRAIAERWVAPRKRWGIERLERACSEGHCRAGLNIEAALDVLYGPLYARLLMSLDAPSDAKVRGYLELAMTAIFTT